MNFEWNPRHPSSHYRWPGRAYVWSYWKVKVGVPQRRDKIRHWFQRTAYQKCPLWMLSICDAAIWLLKTRQQRAWDKQIAASAEGMLFVDSAFPNLVLVNESGSKVPYRGSYTYLGGVRPLRFVSQGDPVRDLLQDRMPKGHHIEATDLTEKLPD